MAKSTGKKHLNFYELHVICKEINTLLPRRISQIYQKQNHFLFNIGKGDFIRIMLPNLIYVSHKKETYDHPESFALILRKYLKGGILLEIKQYESERILMFNIKKQEKNHLLIAEFFSKGNLILCNDENTIIKAYREKIGRKSFLTGEKYNIYKTKENINLFNIDKTKFLEIFDHDLKKLIKEGFGKVYGYELYLSKKPYERWQELITEKAKGIIYVIKNNNPKNLKIKHYLSKDDMSKDLLSKANQKEYKLSDKKLKNTTIAEIDKDTEEDIQVIDITPIKLKYYEEYYYEESNKKDEVNNKQNHNTDKHSTKKNIVIIEKPSFSEALDEFTEIWVVEEDSYLKSLTNSLKKQQERKEKLKKEIERLRKIGDFLFEHYSEIQELLESIKTKFKDGKDKLIEFLKNNKIPYSELNLKERSIVIEFNSGLENQE